MHYFIFIIVIKMQCNLTVEVFMFITICRFRSGYGLIFYIFCNQLTFVDWFFFNIIPDLQLGFAEAFTESSSNFVAFRCRLEREKPQLILKNINCERNYNFLSSRSMEYLLPSIFIYAWHYIPYTLSTLHWKTLYSKPTLL